VTDYCRAAIGARIKPQVHLRLAALDPMSIGNAQDIGRSIDATKGNQYPFGLKCTTAESCTSDNDCDGPRPCSANGFCSSVKDSCTGLCQP
jgi:hypothetical protein